MSWNNGYYFTQCTRCGRDLVRTSFGRWHEPRGYRVVWQPHPPANVNTAQLVAPKPAPPSGDAELPIQEVLRHLQNGTPSSDLAAADPQLPDEVAAEEPPEDEPAVIEPESESMTVEEEPAEEPVAAEEEPESAADEAPESAADEADQGVQAVEEVVEEPPKRVLWSSIPDFMDDSGSRPPSVPHPAAAHSVGEVEHRAEAPRESGPQGPGLGTRLQARIAGLFAWHPESAEAAAAAVPPHPEPVPGPTPPPPAEPISTEPEIEPAAEAAAPSAAEPPPTPADHAPLAATEPEPAASEAAPEAEPEAEPEPNAPPGRDLHRLGIILVVASSLLLILVAILLWVGARNLPGAGDDRAAAPLGRDREQVAFVTASLLNCRSAPARQSDSLSVMRRGDAVSLLARDGDWISVANEGGQCWVLARYLSLQPPL